MISMYSWREPPFIWSVDEPLYLLSTLLVPCFSAVQKIFQALNLTTISQMSDNCLFFCHFYLFYEGNVFGNCASDFYWNCIVKNYRLNNNLKAFLLNQLFFFLLKAWRHQQQQQHKATNNIPPLYVANFLEHSSAADIVEQNSHMHHGLDTFKSLQLQWVLTVNNSQLLKHTITKTIHWFKMFVFFLSNSK